MGHVASAVSVITTTVDGVPKGTTVSAVCSLSLDLAMVLVSLDRNSELLEAIRQTGVFGVNVLDRTQADLGLRFAKKAATSSRAACVSSRTARCTSPARTAGLRGRSDRAGRRLLLTLRQRDLEDDGAGRAAHLLQAHLRHPRRSNSRLSFAFAPKRTLELQLLDPFPTARPPLSTGGCD